MSNKSEILNEIKEISPLLASLNKTEVYTVPDNYFDNFCTGILSKINLSHNEQVDELSEIAPTLKSISRQNVYDIPGSYFESFKVNIPATESNIAKIIPVKRVNRFFKYAVAAVFAGIIFTGGSLYYHYKTNPTANIAKAMKNVSDDELNKYADEYGIQMNYDSLADDDSELNIASELKSLSNEELERYYNEHLQIVSQEN